LLFLVSKKRWVATALWLACAFAWGQTQHAMELERQGQWKDAEGAWRQVLQQNHRDAMAFAHLGLVLAREQDYPGAVNAYQQALKLNPKIPGLQLDLGLALFKEGELKQALLPLRAAAAANPRDSQPRILLGMSYYGMGHFAEAIPYLRFAASQSPRNEELLGVLAQSCLYAKQYDCTLQVYKRILMVDPNSAQAHMLAAEALDAQRRTAEAITEFRAAEKVAPEEPNVHFGLGYLLWTQSQYPEAEQEFELELKNDPNHAQALTYLGDTEMKLQKPAQEYLEQAVALPAAPRLAWLDLGIVLADQGRNKNAEVDFQRAIAMDPTQVDAHWRLARLYQAEGKKDEARAEFAKAATLHQHQDESEVQRISGPHPPPHP
jgi:tetratricopeptide (TPR) repeat protein